MQEELGGRVRDLRTPGPPSYTIPNVRPSCQRTSRDRFACSDAMTSSAGMPCSGRVTARMLDAIDSYLSPANVRSGIQNHDHAASSATGNPRSTVAKEP